MSKLNNLFPKRSYFVLSGIKKSLCIEPITLGKYAEANEELGDIDKSLGTGLLSEICKVTYFFLDEKSKKNFKKRKFKTIDIDGVSKTETIGGYKLLVRKIMSKEDSDGMTVALLQAMGYDDDEISKIMNEDEVISSKKKAMK